MPGEIIIEASAVVEGGASSTSTSSGNDRKPTLIGFDIDTTGKRLIDEIVQLAAYTPENQFSQYIIPYMNLNQAAKMRHQVRVITIGFFRMLKNMQTHKVVKTKTEYNALTDFLEWLEEIRRKEADSSTGLVLVYHDQRQFVPCMLLSALERYHMMSRFSETVVGFANTYSLAIKKCGKPIKYLTLRQMAKMFFNYTTEEEQKLFDGNASVRAKLSYDVYLYLLDKEVEERGEEKSEEKDESGEVEKNDEEVGGEEGDPEDSGVGDGDKVSALKNKSTKKLEKADDGMIMGLEAGLEALSEQQEVINRQNSLRPLFVNYFRAKIYHRARAVDFRRSLAEHGFDLDKLHVIWEDKKTDGISEAIDMLDELGDRKSELVNIIDSHFDPEKSPLKPVGGGGGGGGGNNHNHNNGRRPPFRPRMKNFSTNSMPPTEVVN